MATTTQRHLLLAALGAASGAFGIPFEAGAVQLPSVVLIFLPGVVFSLIVLVATSIIYPAMRINIGYTRWLSSAAAAVFGIPASLYSGAVILNLEDHLVPGTHYQFGGIGLTFFIAELASSATWSLFLSLCILSLGGKRALSLLVFCLSITFSVVVLSNVLEAASTILLHRSIFLAVVSIALQMASALAVSIGVARSTRSRTSTGDTIPDRWQASERTTGDPLV